MNDITNKKTEYELSATKINKISKQKEELQEFKKIQEKSGLFEVFKHNISGREMNDITNKIQSKFIKINEKINLLYSEYGKIYDAFKELNIEVIQSIDNIEKDVNNDVVKCKEKIAELEAKTKELFHVVSSYKEEKVKINKNLKLCWFMSIFMLLIIIILLLIIFL